VLQENFMFNGTVAENISIHCPSATMEQIIKCARIAGAHDFILELPNGYDTVIGEKRHGTFRRSEAENRNCKSHSQ